MFSAENDYDAQLKKAFQRAQEMMESLAPRKGQPRATTTDSVMVFVHHFGKWCAKFDTVSGLPYYAFGSTLLEALTKLVENPLHGTADEYK